MVPTGYVDEIPYSTVTSPQKLLFQCKRFGAGVRRISRIEAYLTIFLKAKSNSSALLGGFKRKRLSTSVSTPAFFKKIALWIANNPSSTTSSMCAGGGCKPQYRVLGTYELRVTKCLIFNIKRKKIRIYLETGG